MRFFSTKPHKTRTKAPSALLTSSLKQSSYAKYASRFRSLSPRIWGFSATSRATVFFVAIVVILAPLFLVTTRTNAAPNYQMNYQGKLTNASNVAVADGTYNMRFWLLTTSSIATTSAVWTESLTGSNKVQVTNGLFSVMLGSTSPLTSLDFNQTLYLGVEIGGTSTPAWDGEMSPRKVLGTVPAAFEADKLDGLTSTQFVRTDATSTIASSSPETLLTITQNGVGDILNLFDGTEEVFSVLDGGNVGIGSTSPSRKLTVQGGDFWLGGNLTATGTATFGALSVSGATSFTYASTTGLTATYANFTNATTSNLKLTGVTASRALFTDASNLLTTSGVSQYLIDAISDETGTGNLVFSNAPTFTGTAAFNAFTVTSTSTLAYASATALTVSGNSYFNFASSSYASTTGFTAQKVYGSDGIFSNALTVNRVGATSTMNENMLRVNTNPTGAGGVAIYTNGDSDTGAATINFGDYTGGGTTKWYAGVNADAYATAAEQNAFYIYQNKDKNDSLVASYRFIINDAGKVGIGTSSPSRLLTVAGGDAYFGGNITAASSTITYASTTGLTATYANFTNATTSNLKLTGVTASRALFTDASNLLTTSGVSQYLIDAITDETGTGSLVFSASPVFSGTAQFDGLSVSSSSTLGYASSTALTVSGKTYLTYASSSGISAVGNITLTSQGSRLTSSAVGTINYLELDDSGGSGNTVLSSTGAIGIRSDVNNNSTGGITLSDNNSTMLALSNDSNTQTFSIDGTEKMRLTTTGLGIGSTSPNAKLSVHAIAGETNPLLFTIASSTASATTTLFSVSNAGLASLIDLSVSGNTYLSGLSDGCLSTVSGLVTSSGVACGSGSGTSDWELTLGGGAITPTTTVGIAVFASSTIGDGTGAGGLTINGGATTTGNAYFGGMLSLGSTTPGASLTVVGSGVTDLFNFASSSGSNFLTLDQRGVLTFGSSATSSIYISGGSASAYTNTNVNANNIAIGNNNLVYILPDGGAQEGGYNIAIGRDVLTGSSTAPMLGNYNIGLGYQALTKNTDGAENIGLGNSALADNTVGGGNIALGSSALASNVVGSSNIALGSNALSLKETGDQNVAIGLNALTQLTTGGNNVAVGSYAGGGSMSISTDISNNVFLGSAAGVSQTRGSQNIALGYRADLASTTGSNQLNIGNLIYGTNLDGTFATLSTGNIGIGSTTPSRKLTVAGDIFASGRMIAGSSTITYASSTGLTSTYANFTGATSSSLYTTTLGTNSEYFTDLTGSGLQNSSNALTCITSNSSTFGCLTSEDWSIFNNKVSSTSIDTSSELASLLTDETGSAGNLVFSGNPLLAGFRSSASSTIGDGTATGGLTIYGNGTTTGNAYIAGTLGIGSRNPSTTLEVVGIASSTFFYAGAGVATTPSITFGGDTNTGLYNPSADSIALVSGGALGLRTTNNQAHLFTNQIFSSYAAQIGDYSNGATPVNSAAGSTGAGSSVINAAANGGGGGSVPPSAFSAAMYSSSDGSIEDWWYGLINQRMGGTGWDSGPGALSQGDYIPGIGFAGQSGTTQGTHMELSAAIQGIIDSTVSSNVMPIGLIFRTSQTDSSALREHMRITSTGTIGIGTTSPNAKLSIHAKNGETNPYLFVIASSTGSATTTLFSVSNTGLASLVDLSVSGGATSSSLYTTTLGLNSEYFTDLTGSGLQNSSNALTCITSNSSTFGCLTSEDWSIFNNKVSSTSIDTSSELASLLTDETGSAGNLVFSGNPLLAGFRSSASSTIGDGTATGGLTIYGNGTTTGNAYFAGNVGIGTTTPSSLLTIGTTSLSGAQVAGIKQHFGFVNSVQDAVYYGNETYITNVPTATSTLVGNMIRIADTSTLGNTVRGFEAQAFRGTNTKGENTGLSGFGRTFGVRGTTLGDAGDTYIPAGIFAESQGTTQGNALRAYSGTITTEELVSLFHDGSVFTGTGLQMNFGNAGGSFAATSSAKFLDLQVAGTSKFTIGANGSTTIGDGVTSASLRIPFGGICVDNDGSCISTTTGQIRSVTSALGNSDLAETYFSNQTLHAGEIVSITGGLSIKRAVEETEKDIIGVVSTKPGLTLGFDDTSLIPGENSYPIGLKGRVPIKLSTENGPIKKGDRIALSSIPGVGMKATESSRVVGIALEDYDGTRAYTEGFLNQFGDDMYKEKIVATQTIDPRSQDGCSNGGGNALGEEACVAQKVKKMKLPTPKIDTTREDALRAFAQESALQTTSANGEVAYVGQAIMFIELTNYQIAGETRILSELASSTGLLDAREGETVWSRIKTLAQNFVDGVLSVTGIKADRVEVKNELCVDGVCVTADDLRAILQNAHQAPQSAPSPQNNTGGGGGGVSIDPGTSSPPPSTGENTGSGGGTTEPAPQISEDAPTPPEPTTESPAPNPEPPALEPVAPSPSPEPPAPEPAPST